jgi:hypothetical protein
MIQQQSLSYSEFMTLFAQMICAFIFPKTTNRFSIGLIRNYILLKEEFFFKVDFGAIWCQALCNIIDAFPNTTSFTSVGSINKDF